MNDVDENGELQGLGAFLGVAALIVAGALVAAGLDRCAGEGSPEGVRGTLSGVWHRSACAVALCDEEGRCPVWSGKYGKCYMLDSAGRMRLESYEKGGYGRREFEHDLELLRKMGVE